MKKSDLDTKTSSCRPPIINGQGYCLPFIFMIDDHNIFASLVILTEPCIPL